MFSFLSKEQSDNEYPVKLFGQQVIDIDITVDEDVWSEMLENKMSKPYIACDLTIDGKEYKSVGLRPKGNSSLTSIQGDRISYRLDFDHYIDNQTCYGLEQMVLNNLQADATYMKDFIAYDLMAYMGVKAPLHTYALIKINGKPFGVYLAVEVYDEDYLARAFSNTQVQLYSKNKTCPYCRPENSVNVTEPYVQPAGIQQTQGCEADSFPVTQPQDGSFPKTAPIDNDLSGEFGHTEPLDPSRWSTKPSGGGTVYIA